MNWGGIEFEPGAGLAPMAGVTDMPFRRIARDLGASWTVTEMISAKGFLHAPKDCRACRELLWRDPEEGITGLQLFGHEPALLAEAARRLEEKGFAFFDINMGCPARKIVSGGDGSALMEKPELAGRVVEAVANATRLPVTVKMRSGPDEGRVLAKKLAYIVQESGARMITVHPRTRLQQYGGRADWDVIAQVVERVHIPVVGNGDVTTGADALAMLRETGCQGVAVGRAAQGNPWIFGEIRAALTGDDWTPPDWEERVRTALFHLDREVALRGEKSAVLMMRKQLSWYISGRRGGARMRALLHQAVTRDQVAQILAATEEDE